jgi:hypothetical protein
LQVSASARTRSSKVCCSGIRVFIHHLGERAVPPTEVARQIVRVVDLPKGARPFPVHIDPIHDGTGEVFELGGRIRGEFFRRIGFDGLLRPALS